MVFYSILCYINVMKSSFIVVLFFAGALCYSQETTPISDHESEPEHKKFSLETAINLAVENNYDIKKQRYALQIAHSQLLQEKGATDIEAGVQAQYQYKQNPVDALDPNYQYGYSWLSPNNDSGIYSNNTLTEQTAGSVFLKKLFSFGLETKLSYTIQRRKDKPNYSYGKNFDTKNLSKYEQENGRNNGEVTLELSLPLFKSFWNSLTSLQIDAAKNYLDQMEFALADTISKQIINVTNLYWNYFLTYKNVEQLEILQKKIEERNKSMDSLIRAGVRSKNDLLAMQVNVHENRKQVQDAKIQHNQAKMELLTALGISDASIIGDPQDSFDEAELKSVEPPRSEELTNEIINSIVENRNDLKALKKHLDIASLQVRLAKADSLPDANLNFGIGTTGTTYSDDTGKFFGSGFQNNRGLNLSGSLSVSAKLGNHTKKGSVEKAEADYNTALADYNKTKNTISVQIQNAAEKLEIYKGLVRDADEDLKLNQNLYENEQRRFTAGLITVDNLLSQDQKYIAAKTSYYQVLINYMQAILEFKYYTANMVGIE